MTIYSNPRLRAEIPDWPNGRTQRVTALFTIEQSGKGERAVRVTTGAPKKLTYASKVRIVDGDDGRTYIAELTTYGHISIMQGDMKFQHEVIHDSNPRYREIFALLFPEEEGTHTPEEQLPTIYNCNNCIRTTSSRYGLQTAEKYFGETPCGIVICDWCREVHEQGCEMCREETENAEDEDDTDEE